MMYAGTSYVLCRGHQVKDKVIGAKRVCLSRLRVVYLRLKGKLINDNSSSSSLN